MCTFRTNHLSLFTLTIPYAFCDYVNDVSPNECNALIDLYNSTNGSGWTNTGGWLVGTGVCAWSGVSCDAGHVGGLNLENNSLSWTLPESFGNLTGLTQLYFNGNRLSQLSNSFGNLTGLTYIRLDGNKLSSLPANFGNLSNVQVLYLSNNQLTGLSANFGNLSNVATLNLASNLLTALPASISGLSNLSSLNLYNNQLTALPTSFGNLTGLMALYLGSNPQLTALPTSFANLTGLTHLDLSYDVFTGLSANFGNLVNLTELYLNDNAYLTSLPASIGNLSHLTTLYLTSNPQLTALPASLIQLLQSHPAIDFEASNSPLLDATVATTLYSGSSFSGSLLVDGNQYIGFSGATWNGSFLPPQPATWAKLAVQGEPGLLIPPIQTIEVWSTTADLIPYTGAFTISVKVASWTSGQQLNVLRSNYNDGNTWTGNTPQATCMIDSNKMCIFQANHLSLFTFTLVDTTPPVVNLLTPNNGSTLSGNEHIVFNWTGADTWVGLSGYNFALYKRVNPSFVFVTWTDTTSTQVVLPTTILTDGAQYRWNIIASDLSNNTWTALTSYLFLYRDTIAPYGVTAFPSTGTWTNGNVYVSLTGGNEPLTGFNATGHLFTGNGSFLFIFHDFANNTWYATGIVTWIDKTPPVVTWSLPMSGSTLTGSRDIGFSWAGNDDLAGISGYTLHLSGINLASPFNTSYPTTANSFTVTNRPNGNYVRRVDIQDNAGNSSSTPIIPFTLHVPLTTTRSITWTNFIFNSPTYYTTGYIGVSVIGNQSASCTVTGNTTPYTSVISSLGTTFNMLLTWADGSKTLYFNCSTGVDTSAFTVSSLYLDTTWPLAPTLSYPTSGGSVSGDFVLTWTVPTDVGIGVSGYNYYVSSASGTVLKSWTTASTWVSIANFELGTTGTYSRYVVAKDKLGTLWLASPLQSFIYSGVYNYTPSSFSFGSIIDATTKTSYTSSKATIAGLSTGLYSLASVDKWVLYINDVMTGSSGYVKNGDTVSIEIISSHNYSTRIRSLLTIGDFSASFSVTTAVDDGTTTTDSNSNLSTTEKLQVAIIFTTLKDLYSSSSLRTDFLNTLLSMINSKISELEGDTASSSTQKKIDTLQYLYDLTHEYLGPDSIVDTSNRYTAPNGKVYSISYNSTTQKFTSPNFIYVKTFSTLDALKAYIDKNNGGISGGGYSVTGGGRDHVVDSTRQAAPYTAPGGKVYHLFKTTDNRYSSYDFKSAKYFSSVETLKAHIYAANKK